MRVVNHGLGSQPAIPAQPARERTRVLAGPCRSSLSLHSHQHLRLGLIRLEVGRVGILQRAEYLQADWG